MLVGSSNNNNRSNTNIITNRTLMFKLDYMLLADMVNNMLMTYIALNYVWIASQQITTADHFNKEMLILYKTVGSVLR